MFVYVQMSGTALLHVRIEILQYTVVVLYVGAAAFRNPVYGDNMCSRSPMSSQLVARIFAAVLYAADKSKQA